ncbi:MAG: BrnA antitoxin family protein [Thermodesulfobacteriota bacterium]|nr:BrnA antitoxin family protein [Thermodesulfobacteriota bacterium]
MPNDKHKSQMVDEENPEWTDEMFSRATRVEDSSLPEAFKAQVRRGRPPEINRKLPISIRLSVDVVEFFKASGKGWQTRMDAVLKEYVSKHH